MCFEDRKTPTRCIMVLSALAAICGLVMIVFSFMLTNNDVIENMEKENADIGDAKKLIFLVLLIFSLITIVIAALGFMFACCKNRCFAVLYGLLLLPSFIVIVIIGAVSIAASVAASDTIEEECAKLAADTTM